MISFGVMVNGKNICALRCYELPVEGDVLALGDKEYRVTGRTFNYGPDRSSDGYLEPCLIFIHVAPIVDLSGFRPEKP